MFTFYLCHQAEVMTNGQGSYGNGNVGNTISQTVIRPSAPRDSNMLYHKKCGIKFTSFPALDKTDVLVHKKPIPRKYGTHTK